METSHAIGVRVSVRTEGFAGEATLGAMHTDLELSNGETEAKRKGPHLRLRTSRGRTWQGIGPYVRM